MTMRLYYYRIIPAILAVIATVGTLLLTSTSDPPSPLQLKQQTESQDKEQHGHGRSLALLSRFNDPKSSHPRSALGTHFRVTGWNADEGFFEMEIIQPKDDCQYSVTIVSTNKYSGVAQLMQVGDPLVYVWRPIFPLDYEILVHELNPKKKGGADPTTMIVSPGILPISVSEELIMGSQYVTLLNKMWDEAPPCQTLWGKMDAISTWDGFWVGPDLVTVATNLENNMLRTGWTFLPSLEMNCHIETFSSNDLLSIPAGPDNGKLEKSIYVIGTSVMRGVFLALADLLLPGSDKASMTGTIGRCWGRAEIQKGNLKLLYQDFRYELLEQPDKVGLNTYQCHNNKVVKEGSEFLPKAYQVWEEVFHHENHWPDVIFFGVGFENYKKDVVLYDFASHTLEFVKRLPPAWNGTLIISDGQFSGSLSGLGDIQRYTTYRSDIRSLLDTMDDPRVRWMDGMGLSKEMRMYTEVGPSRVAGSAHFHSKCRNRAYSPDGKTDGGHMMMYCSNITEVTAQMLLGHALGPKEAFQEQVQKSRSHNIGLRKQLETCTACPAKLMPIHLIPYPEKECYSGPLHPQKKETYTEPVKECPESCLKREADRSFPSQSDMVYVRECPYD
mmetsp:Transcript_24480/g.44995  ORF Transcript_24480/g.44995 Transcript_24480/m.44995 type:complete len:613 (-) Transcript_24480:124-1962(-)|eukprot:CAMPEP_0202022824 /NCGR_PEP_ID=MMETSP0905-20130828/50471_1 /ASSEMBLY_ACC=CAM_ASM_000554 /TAXON_ID=420261 /ORGANISM="Thalassiosira antarctica, Strain CCMP982" /LENGTH=612 /DNA_ID=CAMNT_0048585059 /DNA_START=96 /DNA_END=1934 /DNA_ORIENTATION=+